MVMSARRFNSVAEAIVVATGATVITALLMWRVRLLHSRDRHNIPLVVPGCRERDPTLRTPKVFEAPKYL
jgi:hypothetical protein